MDKDSLNLICIAFPFREFPYDWRDIEFMMPAIIHRHFEHTKEFFEHYVAVNLNTSPDDKGGYLMKLAYYENMADMVAKYLELIDNEKILTNTLATHYVDEAQIICQDGSRKYVGTLLLKFCAKTGSNNKY